MNYNIYQSKSIIMSLVVGLMLIAMSFLQAQQASAATEHREPHDATLQVKIEYVKALDCVDDIEILGVHFCESEADLSTVVHIAGERFEGHIIKDQDEITPSDWTFSKQISVSNELTQSLIVKIEVWDNDDDLHGGRNDEMDLDPDSDNPLNLAINLNDCIEKKPGAVSGDVGSPKDCFEIITSQGILGNPAIIKFQITADTPKDTFIVKDEAGEPVAGAEVRLFRGDEPRSVYITATDGSVSIPCPQTGDELVAMQLLHTEPINDTTHQGWHYHTYITSLNYEEATGEALPYVVGNETCGSVPIELVVKKRSPLVLFNLIVSVWWGAYGEDEERDSNTFLDRLKNALHSANSVVFDVTDGQFAFGDVTIYDGRNYWGEADIQILPSNYMRPWATPGGITRGAPYTYTSSAFSTTVFYPGHIRIGRAWDQGNNPDAYLDNHDGFSMIAHEFMHYAFMLLDEYFYFDSNNVLQPAHCPGSLMDDSYAINPELPMQGSLLWAESCKQSEQYLTHGESAWETITRIYSDTSSPARWEFRIPETGKSPKEGPSSLPFDLAKIQAISQGFNPLVNGNGQVKVSVRNVNEEGFYPGEVEVFLLRKNSENALRIYDQGTVSNTGVIELVGVKANDEILATSWDGRDYGAKTYIAGTLMMLNVGEPVWQPIVTALPITNSQNQITGISVAISQAGTVNGEIMASIVPLDRRVTVTDAILLQFDGMRYTGAFNFDVDQTLDDAFIWIGEVQDRNQIFNHVSKQIVVPYAIGGSPDSHKRSNPPRHPASSDGYCHFHFPESTWTTDLPALVLSPHNLPMFQKDSVLASAPCYLGVPESITDFPESVSLSIYYNRESIRSIDDSQLRIYWWNEQNAKWQMMSNYRIDTSAHSISANIDHPGLYAAMTVPSSQTTLLGRIQSGGPVANVITATQNLSTTTVLAECKNPIVIGFAAEEIERYYTDVQSYVSNLHEFQTNQHYFIAVDEECIIDLKGRESSNSAISDVAVSALQMQSSQTITVPLESLPATYYGRITFEAQSIATGITVTAFISDTPIASAQVVSYEGQSVFVMDILADNQNTQQLEGGHKDQIVTFQVGCTKEEFMASWRPAQAQEINVALTASPKCTQPLDPNSNHVYLPLVNR